MTASDEKTHISLIIDDNWYYRDIFRMALEEARYEVMQAEGGYLGSELLENNPVDLLVLDLHMPDIDGYEVLRKMRSQSRFDATRILVVTANADMATDEVSDLADFIMYKPISIIEFSQFVLRLKKSFTAG